ncbi:hypothetical protein ACFUJR_01315 [Streptomyces sp. NPDC057271]|uniref:hypothetical protein n=1 Tax=unclassified Streptomyces TaxID=2593676 RepID=UPI0036264CB6
MKRFKAAVLAAAVVAGIGLAATPAEASTCKHGGIQYRCEYHRTTQSFGDGTQQVFVIGLDDAVWTRWSYANGSWSRWQSMGGVARSQVSIPRSSADGWEFEMAVKGTDGKWWGRSRDRGGNWTGWYRLPV